VEALLHFVVIDCGVSVLDNASLYFVLVKSKKVLSLCYLLEVPQMSICLFIEMNSKLGVFNPPLEALS